MRQVKVLKPLKFFVFRPFVWSLVLAILAQLTPIFASPGLNRFQKNEFVRNLEDFKHHILLHRMRVVRLGLAIRNRWPEKFGSLTDIEIFDFLKLHDISKWFDSPRFREEFWPTSSQKQRFSFSERFFEFYGVQLDHLEGPEKDRFRGLIADLNKSDQAVTLKFFRNQPRLRASAQGTHPRAILLLELERLADLADRDSDPVAREEMGLPERKSLQRYVTEPEELWLLRDLREDYPHIVQGLNYTDGCSLAPILGRALFNRPPRYLGR